MPYLVIKELWETWNDEIVRATNERMRKHPKFTPPNNSQFFCFANECILQVYKLTIQRKLHHHKKYALEFVSSNLLITSESRLVNTGSAAVCNFPSLHPISYPKNLTISIKCNLWIRLEINLTGNSLLYNTAQKWVIYDKKFQILIRWKYVFAWKCYPLIILLSNRLETRSIDSKWARNKDRLILDSINFDFLISWEQMKSEKF